MALCNFCGENIVQISLKDSKFIEANKFMILYFDSILNHEPYNKFSNLKYYFDDIFYLFNYYNKISFDSDKHLIIRLTIDNLILISSKRLELEKKYFNEILNKEIFLLRLTNNFFESSNEKEKYKNEKEYFTIFFILIIIIVIMPISNYINIIHERKSINIFNNRYKNISLFDLSISLIINYFFKKIKIEFYLDLTETERIKKIINTLKIYKQEFNEELNLFYLEKEDIFNNFCLNYVKYTPLALSGIDIGSYVDKKISTGTKIIKNYLSEKTIYKNCIKNKILTKKKSYNIEYIENKITINFKNFNKNLIKEKYNKIIQEIYNLNSFVYKNKEYDKIRILESDNNLIILNNNKEYIILNKEESKYIKINKEISPKLKLILYQDILIIYFDKFSESLFFTFINILSDFISDLLGFKLELINISFSVEKNLFENIIEFELTILYYLYSKNKFYKKKLESDISLLFKENGI